MSLELPDATHGPDASSGYEAPSATDRGGLPTGIEYDEYPTLLAAAHAKAQQRQAAASTSEPVPAAEVPSTQ